MNSIEDELGPRSDEWMAALGARDLIVEEAFDHTFIEVPECELWLQCRKCKKENFFYAADMADTIAAVRDAGWGLDEMEISPICPNCLEV